jgi:hypothetical protein
VALGKEREMKKMHKPWVAAVAAALLVGALLGVVSARPNQQPKAADITRKVTVPGAFFNPRQPGYDWYNDSHYIATSTGGGIFLAPVVFPCLPSVTVERVILYVDDKNGTSDACAHLIRSRPQHGDQKTMGSVCSSDTTTGVQTFVDSSISPDVVWPGHGVNVWLAIGGTSIKVHAVRVEYHRNI